VPLLVPEPPAVMWRKAAGLAELVEAVQLHPELVLTVKVFPVLAAPTTVALEALNE